jgi:NAD(P)-dependent dehydrogenase (short-subunit alcohol dehydrogenase family)
MSSKKMGLLPTVVGVSAAAACALAVWWAHSSSKKCFTPKPGSLQGKTIVITGGTSGLGLESAKRLALGGADIVVTARSDAKGQAAVKEIIEHVEQLKEGSLPPPTVSYRLLDMDDLSKVKEVANWKDLPKIDVLMNNAGVMAIPTQQLTVDGFERQIQSNHLGHFILTKLLFPKLTPKARIINMSSYGHTFTAPKGLDLDYFWKGEPGYSGFKSYGQSKLANILFTNELQRRSDAAGLGLTCVSVHPGLVDTGLSRNLIGEDTAGKLKRGEATVWERAFMGLAEMARLFSKTPEQGADSQIWLASGMGENVSSKYFVDCKEQSLGKYATDEVAAKKLWEESEEKSGMKFQL